LAFGLLLPLAFLFPRVQPTPTINSLASAEQTQVGDIAMKRAHGAVQPGIKWGPFTARIPFIHVKLEWQEFVQGLLVSAATGMALVPILTAYFGLSFEEAVACSMIHTTLIISSVFVFGEPYAPGWITPVLPLVLAFVLKGYELPVERFQAMAALAINFSALLLIFGVTGIGKKLMEWVPQVLKAGMIMGAAIAAFKQVFVDDAPRFLNEQPITITIACAVCLIFMFSIPMALAKQKYKPLAILASLGLLPGFIVAAIVGPLVGEVSYEIEWGIAIPPFADAIEKTSPFFIGWPSLDMLQAAIPLALVAYVLLFGDWVTGNAVIREAQSERPDEAIDINPTRSHLSVGIRNALLALVSPMFPTQGALWTGMHVAVVQRWKEGRDQMDSLMGGIGSINMMGMPFIYFLLPVLTGLKPLMGVALSLTLVLTGFACAYVAMEMVKNSTERGTIVLIGIALALFSPWIGLAIAVLATLTLVGWDKPTETAEQES
jgi:hypothetical protein